MPPPTFTQMYSAASDIIMTLESLDVEPAFVGSMAGKLIGCERRPGDLDILCQNWYGTQEELKDTLVLINLNFYLVRSKNPSATYKVLWYRIGYRCNVKVDILLPGALDFSPIPSNAIERPMGLPCAPLSYLLLYKLQGWIHHGESERQIDNVKVPADITDIKALLEIAVHKEIKPFTEPYFDAEFMSKTRSRVERFIYEHEVTLPLWWLLGYETEAIFAFAS